ncbi:MAG TPA: YtxH domain-containing protein [Smithella sp.]|nr:YtxH domain-containing protein [Smithella sp.]
MSEKNSDLLKGLFVGGLIGMALGVLFAPKSGRQTREDITRRADELLVKAKKEYGKAVEKSKTAYNTAANNLKDLGTTAQEKAADVEGKVSEFVHQGAEVIQSNKNRLKMAIDAGLEAYREEKSKKTI